MSNSAITIKEQVEESPNDGYNSLDSMNQYHRIKLVDSFLPLHKESRNKLAYPRGNHDWRTRYIDK